MFLCKVHISVYSVNREGYPGASLNVLTLSKLCLDGGF